MVDGPGIPFADGLTVLRTLALMTPSNRLSVLEDFESGDARSKSKAISCAAEKPHIPDGRIVRNVLILKEIAKGQAIGDEPEYCDVVTSIETLQARLNEEYKREAAILARRRAPNITSNRVDSTDVGLKRLKQDLLKKYGSRNPKSFRQFDAFDVGVDGGDDMFHPDSDGVCIFSTTANELMHSANVRVFIDAETSRGDAIEMLKKLTKTVERDEFLPLKNDLAILTAAEANSSF